MAHLNVYRGITNFVYRLVRVTDSKAWDDVNGELSASPTWADTAISVTKNNYIGGFPIDLTSDLSASLPPGDYDLLIYDSASPASSDTVELGKRISWTGKQLIITDPDVKDI